MVFKSHMNREIKAYAKVNLHLEVLNRRKDGFHNIMSLMSKIRLYDLLKLDPVNLKKGDDDLKVTFSDVSGPFSEVISGLPLNDNLIVRALRLYCLKAGLCGEVKIGIEKNIPSGAGLAGGSSDAAAALNLVNKIMDYPLSSEELNSLGTEIGADVPFCLQKSPSAFCEGTGDKIEALDISSDDSILLLNNGIHVDTSYAYRSLGRGESIDVNESVLESRKKSIKQILEKSGLREASNLFYNDFEKPVFDRFPETASLKNEVIKEGAYFAIMTGSGSTVIALFKDKKKLKKAETTFKKRLQTVFVTGFLKD